MKTIVTIQHTQSVHHTNGMVGSQTDWPLTETGRQQAQRIAQNLRAELPDAPWALYSSDLTRARQTAAPIAEAFGIPIQLRKELRERNLGECCGQSVEWLRTHCSPEVTVNDRLFPSAESRRDAWNRLAPFFTELMQSKHTHILIVSHGDLLGTFNALFLGMPVEALNTCALTGLSGGVSFLTVTDTGLRRIARLSDMSFLL